MFATNLIGRTAPGALLVLVATTAAGAEGFSIKLEPGVAVPLSEPQSDIYDVGGGQSVTPNSAFTDCPPPTS